MPVANADVFVGNAALEYRKLGTTGDDGKVSGTLAAAELFFVREEPYHLKVELQVDGKTVTKYLALNSGGNELIVPKDTSINETV